MTKIYDKSNSKNFTEFHETIFEFVINWCQSTFGGNCSPNVIVILLFHKFLEYLNLSFYSMESQKKCYAQDISNEVWHWFNLRDHSSVGMIAILFLNSSI